MKLNPLNFWQQSKQIKKILAIFLLTTTILGVGVSVKQLFLEDWFLLFRQQRKQVMVKRPNYQSKSNDNVSHQQDQDDSQVGETNIGGQVLGDEQGSISLTKSGHYDSNFVTITNQEPQEISARAYDFTGDINFRVFRVNTDFVFDYLLHDAEGKLINKELEFAEFEQVASFSKKFTNEDSQKVSLPLEEEGYWYIHAQDETGAIRDEILIVRTSLLSTVAEGNNQFVFWAYDNQSKRSIGGTEFKIYNLQDKVTNLGQAVSDQQGVAVHQLDHQAHIAVVTVDNRESILPINLRYLGFTLYRAFNEPEIEHKMHIITDRPIYKPGDTVNYKVIARRDRDANYSIPTMPVELEVHQLYRDSDEPVYKQTTPFDSYGTVDGSFRLPENEQATGRFQIHAEVLTNQEYNYGNTSSHFFDVEFYRKPEYTLSVAADPDVIIQGDPLIFNVSGSYFFGQPYQETVDYEAEIGKWRSYYRYRSDYQPEPDNLYVGYGSDRVDSGSVDLNQNGLSQIELELPVINSNHILQFSASSRDDSGNRVSSSKNVLIYAAEYDLTLNYNQSQTRANLGDEIKLALELMPHNQYGNVSQQQLQAEIKRVWWEKKIDPNKKYPKYIKHEEVVANLDATSDDQGRAQFNYLPQHGGSYRWIVTGRDDRGNSVLTKFYSYVNEQGIYNYNSKPNEQPLSINANKESYQPGEEGTLTIYSLVPDRDVFVGFERGYLHRYQVVSLQGHEAEVKTNFVESDMPNIFVNAYGFSQNSFDNASTNIEIDTSQQRLHVDLELGQDRYSPGERVTAQVKTTNNQGQGVPAEVTIWAVDKALFELARDNNDDIFKTFWDTRYNSTAFSHSLLSINSGAERGGCFAGQTPILMSDGKTKEIQDIKKGERVLTKQAASSGQLKAGTVTDVHQATVSGYFIINRHLKVTGNHLVFAGGGFKRVDTLRIGDKMLNAEGLEVEVKSLEWVKDELETYNLTIKDFHTYFANNYYVHNQKGGGARNNFEDAAYWNPKVMTDSQGQATISFIAPDNLTTWMLSGVAHNQATQVGQGAVELIVAKDILVRPVVPNILYGGDEIELAALVHNYTQQEQELAVSLETDAGQVQTPTQQITLKPDELTRVNWLLSVGETAITTGGQNGAIFKFSAVVGDTDSIADDHEKQNGDVVEIMLPIREVGVTETQANAGIGPQTFNVYLKNNVALQQSQAELTLTASMFGSIQPALKYLIGYPYGCAEQITGRLLPLFMVKRNQALFGDIASETDLDRFIQDGIEQLADLQNSDGGWGWWEDHSKIFMIAYVVKGLKQADDLGYDTYGMLAAAQDYFNNQLADLAQADDTQLDVIEKRVLANYGLSIINPDSSRIAIDVDRLEMKAESDLLALAILTDINNGVNPGSKVNWLKNQAQFQGGGAFWQGNGFEHFRAFSSDEAVTALAIKAILAAGGDRDLAAKGGRYLQEQRQRHYWHNTYATVQVVEALEALGQTGRELTPNYSYQVLLDGQPVASGYINDYQQVETIDLPVADFNQDGSKIELIKQGDGQVYSTLVFDQYIVDRQLEPDANGITLERSYQSEKGPDYNIAVGDEVTVTLTLQGLKSSAEFGVLEDELPAGLIAINTNLKNEEKSRDWGRSMNYTQGGIISSLPRIAAHSKSYTYQARAVNAGTFAAPPARVSLMYSPEINAHTGVQQVTISRGSQLVGATGASDQRTKVVPEQPQTITLFARIIGVVSGLAAIAFVGWKISQRRQSARFQEEQNEKQPDSDNS